MTYFEESLSYKLHQLIFCMDFVADKSIKARTNINYTEFLILLALHDISNPTQENVAKWANFTKSTVSKTVDKLVKKNFVSRAENSKDRRQKDITITSSGKTEFKLAKKLVEQISNDLFSVLTAPESAELNRYMDKIYQEGVSKIYQKLSVLSAKI